MRRRWGELEAEAFRKMEGRVEDGLEHEIETGLFLRLMQYIQIHIYIYIYGYVYVKEGLLPPRNA